MISQDPQSRAAGPSPLSQALHFHDDTSPLTPSSRGRDPVPPRTQTGPIRALGRPDKNTQRPAAPMTVCDIRSDSFSITTSAAAWCEESAFVSAKTPPPRHTHTQVAEKKSGGGGGGKKEEGRKRPHSERRIGTFFSARAQGVTGHTGWCHTSGATRHIRVVMVGEGEGALCSQVSSMTPKDGL